jgi:membrane protease YdiL (CAAX protease family)
MFERVSGLVLFVVSLKKESWLELGLTTSLRITDFIIALLLIFTTMLLWIPFSLLIANLGVFVFQKPAIPFATSCSTAEALWDMVTAIIVRFGEEILVRGYLISRLLRLTGPVMSVILSSLVFSVWHIPQGVFTVAHTFIWGLVYGWTFTKIRRLYPLALAHATNNMIAFAGIKWWRIDKREQTQDQVLQSYIVITQ